MEGARPKPARPPSPSRTTDERISNIKNLHDESFLYIQQGLSCDEYGQKEQAVTLYRKGLDSVAKAIQISKGTDDSCTGPEWDKARTMVRKMEKSQNEITSRVEHILQTDTATARAIQDPPPSYETATTPTSETDDMSWADNIMNENLSDSRRSSLNAVDGTELFVIEDGVQIFYITPEGYVSAPSYPSALGVYKLDGQQNRGASNCEAPPAFLRVGDWTYPLLPGTSPMLRSDWGAYIFPDTSSPVIGSAVGVITPDSLSDGERAILEDIFTNFTASHTEQEVLAALENLPALPEGEVRPGVPEQQMEVDETPRDGESERTSGKISKGIVTAAEWIAWGLGKGAEKTGVLLKKGSTALREQIKPDEEQTKVDPKTQKGIYYARQATSGAVKVSYYIVDGLGKATMALGRQLAPHVRKQGEKVLPDSVSKKSEDGKSKIDDVMEVAVGGLHGFGTVYLALEKAAKSLAKSIADETVSVVQHKYGKEVGTATENALYATGNLGLTVNNARNLGIKAIAKRAAKDTGKAVVEDYKKKLESGAAPADEEKNPPGGNRQPPAGRSAGPSGAGLYPTQQLPPQPQ